MSDGTAAQKTPNFTGTWTLQPPARPATNIGGVTGGGKEMSILHNETAIRFTRVYGGGQASLLVKLDGSDSKHSVPSFINEGFTSSLTSVARWDGEKLLIQTLRVTTGGPGRGPARIETIEVLSLTGSRLTVTRASRPVGEKGPTKAIQETYRKSR